MSSKSIIRKTMVTLAAGVCAGLFASSLPAYAQLQVLGASPPVGESASVTSPSKRLVLHDVRVEGPRLSVAPSSRPVLDYAVQILKQYPDTRVYINGQSDNATVRTAAEAVTRYLSQRGIPANRLVLLNPTTSEQVDQRNPTASEADVVVLNFTVPS
jgi:hypothetical protein